jgi:hypothetical protein
MTQTKPPSVFLGIVKIITGFSLGSCCGLFGLYVGAYQGMFATILCSLLLGFGYRWVLTGAAALAGKRVNFFVSLIPVVLLMLPAYFFAPQFSMKREAQDAVRKKDAKELREVVRLVDEHHGNDPRFAEAREIARKGLEDLFKDATEQLKAPPAAKPGPEDLVPDEELRTAFLHVIEDLGAGTDGVVYVAFHNEAKLDPPEGDDVILLLKRSIKEVKDAFPNGDAPVVSQGKAFDAEFDRKRRDTFFKAMEEAFERVFKQKGLLTLVPLADSADRTGKIVFDVSSKAGREASYYTYTQEDKVAGLLFSVKVDWEFAVFDRQGKELYRRKTASNPALNLKYRSTAKDPTWAPYSVMMDSAYYNYCRDVTARFGLTPPEERTEFSFAD